jgi:hypothetical protein
MKHYSVYYKHYDGSYKYMSTIDFNIVYTADTLQNIAKMKKSFIYLRVMRPQMMDLKNLCWTLNHGAMS